MEDTTGPIAGFAAETIAMAQEGVAEVNAQGGVNGRMLNLIVANELPDPVAAAQNLVLQHNVSAIIGVSYSFDAIAIMPFLSANHVIGIFTTASDTHLMDNVTTDPTHYKYFFRLTVTDNNYITGVLDFAKNVSHSASIYFVAEDLGFAHEEFNALNASAPQVGVTVSGSSFVPLSQTDFSTLAAQVVAAHPDLVVDSQTGIGAATFYQQLKANPGSTNIKVLYISNGALADPGVQAYIESSQPGSLNKLSVQIFPGAHGVPVNALQSTLISTYESQTNKTFYSFPSNTYIAVHILANALKTAGTSNVDAIITALEATNYQSSSGLVTFNASHSWNFPGFWYTQIQGNNVVVISPPEFANGAFES